MRPHVDINTCMFTLRTGCRFALPEAVTATDRFHLLLGEGLHQKVHGHVLALLARLSGVAPAETLFAALVEQRRAEEGDMGYKACTSF